MKSKLIFLFLLFHYFFISCTQNNRNLEQLEDMYSELTGDVELYGDEEWKDFFNRYKILIDSLSCYDNRVMQIRKSIDDSLCSVVGRMGIEVKPEWNTFSPCMELKNLDNHENQVMTPEQIYKMCSPAVFECFAHLSDSTISQGSAFFVDSTGIAVSNWHVFRGIRSSKDVSARMKTLASYDVKILKRNVEQDWVIFKVISKGVNFSSIKISSKQNVIGQKVYAIGSPNGLVNTFTDGQISNLWPKGSYSDTVSYIQVNAQVDHGSSGGVLLNEYGEAIGIVTRGIQYVDINQAIDIQELKTSLAEVLKK